MVNGLSIAGRIAEALDVIEEEMGAGAESATLLAQRVRLVRDGLTNKQIASALHYSPKTVEVYLSRIYAKTRCSSRVELVRAMDGGAVEVPVE